MEMRICRIKRIMCGVLLSVFLLQLTGCGGSVTKNGAEETGKPYEEGEAGTVEQQEAGYDRSSPVVLQADIDFSAMGIEYYDDAVELYQDRDLNHKIYCKYRWDKEQKTLSLLPPDYPLLNVSTLFADKAFLREYEHSDYFLFEKGENQDWGNLGRMYLVKWLDLQTGEKLDDPEVTQIEIEGELDRVQNFQFEVSEYGNGMLSWEPVEAAECYLIVEATYLTKDDEISGFYESCDIVAETVDTIWQPEDTGDTMNQEFQLYTAEEEDREYYYGVIAVNKTGTSMVSALIPKREMAGRLPFCEEENGNDGEFGMTRFAGSIDLLSRYQWVRLCDGTMSQRLLRYKIEEAEPVNVDDGDRVKEMLQLPYMVEGTEFEGSFYIERFDRNTYQKDLEELQTRQNILKSKMAGLLKNVEVAVRLEEGAGGDISEKGSAAEKEDESGEENPQESFGNLLDHPTGTTNLSRFLAACLLAGDEEIRISDMQAVSGREEIVDAFYEAYYQNPLIPAVKEISVLGQGEIIAVRYEEDRATRNRKQQQVMEQVAFVSGELEEEGMTDLDKVLAINAYLCDTVDYDNQASDNDMSPGEAEGYSDSMTPFGALVKQKGVCLAYAGAFQLLSKALGVESIVVTGTLNGKQNHAWNKVRIDGEWYVVDVTSNDDPDIANVMLNVSDEVAEAVLKENDRCLCDNSLGQYLADSDKLEYYRLADKYYEKDEIAKAFVQELSLGKKAVLRTDADLTNAEFQSIVKEIMEKLEQTDIQGYYRLGVICLEKKSL
ncbi:MAG: transglutaminase-like domain-containing protein [Clostridium sp.]|nr:transglutaminase-like domain-containing protein [Clostridium sp.]